MSWLVDWPGEPKAAVSQGAAQSVARLSVESGSPGLATTARSFATFARMLVTSLKGADCVSKGEVMPCDKPTSVEAAVISTINNSLAWGQG